MELNLDIFKGTWFWDAPGWVMDTFGPFLPFIIAAIVIVGASIFGVMFVAKGAGQYGIIEGYVGTIGAGKTTLAVQHSMMLAKARNAVLLSNIPVICGQYCKEGPRMQLVTGKGPLKKTLPVFGPPDPATRQHEIEHDTLPMNDAGLDLGELTRRAFRLRDEQRGLVLLMDEVGVIMPARLWKEFSVALMWVLQQSRKLACEWIWTAQDPSFVDHQLRSLTAVVHYVRSYPPPSIWRRSHGKRPWVLIASAFTPAAAPRANGENLRTEKRMGRRMVRYNRQWEASFDTDGVVLPSKHLKGAEVLVDAVEGTQDRHVIRSAASDFGSYVRVVDPDVQSDDEDAA